MRTRQIRRFAEIQLHPAAHLGRGRELREERMSRIRVEKTAHRVAAGRLLRVRRAGIFQIGFELHRRGGLGKLLAGHFAHGVAPLVRNQPFHDHVAFFAQFVNLIFFRFERVLI